MLTLKKENAIIIVEIFVFIFYGKGVDKMKKMKFLSILLCVALLVSVVAFATENDGVADDNVSSIDASNTEIEASYSNGELTVDVYTDSLEEVGVENIDVTIGTTILAADADADIDATVAGYAGAEPIVTVEDSVINIAIDAFDFEIAERTKVLSLSIPVEYTELEATAEETVVFESETLGVEAECDITIEADKVVEAEIKLVKPLINTDAVSILLVDATDDDNTVELDIDSVTDNKIVTVAVNGEAEEFTAANYKLVVSAPGYLTSESVAFKVANGKDLKVTDFLPGDVNGNNEINVYDFNILCSYFANDYEFDSKCDLDKDGYITDDDIEYLFEGFEGGAN